MPNRKDGRVTKDDAVQAKASMGTPGTGKRGESRKKMSMLRRKVAERLVAAKSDSSRVGLQEISCLCDGTKFPSPKQCENLDSEVPEVDGAYYLFAEYRSVPALKDLDPMDAAMHMIEKVSAAGCTTHLVASLSDIKFRPFILGSNRCLEENPSHSVFSHRQ